MEKAITVCDLEYDVLPAGDEGSAKVISIIAVPVIIVILAK